MKHIIIFIVAFSLTNLSNAQTKEKILSKAEQFSTKAGTLIQKKFVEVGSIKSAKVRVIHYTDLISSQTISSVRIEYDVASKYSTDTKIASLDSDEIEGLIKSIKIMQSKVFTSSPTTYTEVTFKSRGGFEAGCYWSKDIWKTYLKLEKFDGKSYVFLNVEDFPELLSLLEKSKSIL